MGKELSGLQFEVPEGGGGPGCKMVQGGYNPLRPRYEAQREAGVRATFSNTPLSRSPNRVSSKSSAFMPRAKALAADWDEPGHGGLR